MSYVRQLKQCGLPAHLKLVQVAYPDVVRVDLLDDTGKLLASSAGKGAKVLPASDYSLTHTVSPNEKLDLTFCVRVRGTLGDLAPRLPGYLDNIGAQIAAELTLRLELDEMAEELGERYEELNLVYKIKQSVDAVSDDRVAMTLSLQQLVDDCATFLNVDVAALIMPGKQLAVASGVVGDDEPDSGIIETLQNAVISSGQAIVINKPEDAKRIGIEGQLEHVLICAPIPSSNPRLRGLFVIAQQKCKGREFSNSDRQLVEIQAEMARKIIKQRYDTATGLVGQGELISRFEAMLQEDKARCSLLFFHFNHLKLITDSFGYEVAGRLLSAFAEMLDDYAGEECVVARINHDEFVIAARGLDTKAAAESVLQRIEDINENRHIVPAGAEFSVNVGSVCDDSSLESVSDWLTAGEFAASLAKDNSFERLHVYSPDDSQLQKRDSDVFWLQNVKTALMNRDFRLYCQPMEALSDGPPHYEVLLRVIDDDGRVMSPAKFIEAAERYDLIPNIDQWVVEEMLSLLAQYKIADVSPESVWSVNLSGKSIGSRDFHHYLLDVLNKNSACNNRQLCFELTETAEIGEMESALKLITEVKALGAAFSLDDFGCGLSSFSYLKEIPVDYLKIDGSFVKDIDSNGVNRSMVKAMASVGKVMGLHTIAEFVETGAVRDLLKDIGVDYAQGYFVAKPVPLDGVLKDIQSAAAKTGRGR